MLLLTAAAALATCFSLENYFIPLSVLWLLFVLILDRNFTDVIYPILLLNAVALRTAGQSTYLVKHIWLVIPVFAVIVIHFILYHRKITVGKCFPALCAVSIALLVGGIGVISPADYFDPSASLYYIGFGGVGLLLFYIWFRNGMFSTESYDLKERMLEILYFLGVFCAFTMLEKMVRMSFLSDGFTPMKWSNDICEMMLFALPVPFYFARKHAWHILVPFLFFASMLPMRSLAALAVGACILALGLVYTACYVPRLRVLALSLLSLGVVGALVGVILFAIPTWDAVVAFFTAEENGRSALFARAWQNFLRYPVLGVGFGYQSGSVTLMGTTWTHNWVLQILGSMGLVGALAYGYQTYIRATLILKGRDASRMMLGLSYLGIFLVSMLQPGEFCPMPYEFFAVALFAVLEITEKQNDVRIALDKTY